MNYEIGHQIPASEIAAHREYVVKQSGRSAPDFFETLRAVRRRSRGKLIRAEPKTAIDLTEARFSARFRGIYDALDFAALADAISLGGVEVRKTRKAQKAGDLVWRAEFTACVGVGRYLDGVSDLRETREHFAAIRVRRELQERDVAPEPEPELEPEPEPVEAGLRRLALKVLTRIAADEGARTADRVAAAGRLAALCGSPRRTTATAAPDPLPPSESRPELSAEDATKRFRVVS